MIYSWRDWALKEPAVIGIIPYHWAFDSKDENGNLRFLGVRDMHPSVLNTHRDIINSINCEYNPEQ